MLNKYTHISHSYILICRYKLVFSRVKQAFITLLAQSVSRICVGLNFSKFRNKMLVGIFSSGFLKVLLMSRVSFFPTSTIPGGYQWII